MHTFIVGVTLFFLELFFIGIIAGLIYLVFFPFKKSLLNSNKINSKQGRYFDIIYISICSICFLFLFTLTYMGVFPDESFYIDEFKRNTGIELPNSANIIKKDATYPDQHGAYWSGAIIELDKSDFKKLKVDISKLATFQIDTTSQKIGISQSYKVLADDILETDLDIVFYNINEQWFKLAFLKDGRTIIFERSSS